LKAYHIQFKHDFLSYLAVQKSIHTLQNNVHMLSFPICNGFTLGPMAQAKLVKMVFQSGHGHHQMVFLSHGY
jgi:hypothetical protein